MNVVLDLATPADLNLLRQFMRQLRLEDPMPAHGPLSQQNSERAIGALIADSQLGRAWLIRLALEEASQAVGYVALTFVHSLEFGGRCAFIDELYISRTRRRRGVAAETLRQVERQAVGLGVRTLLLEVAPANHPATSLYRKSGFRPRSYQMLTKQINGD